VVSVWVIVVESKIAYLRAKEFTEWIIYGVYGYASCGKRASDQSGRYLDIYTLIHHSPDRPILNLPITVGDYEKEFEESVLILIGDCIEAIADAEILKERVVMKI